MDIIEALRTKRNIVAPAISFRRPTLTGNSINNCYTYGVIDRQYFLRDILPYLSEADLLRGDWEVEDVAVTITRQQFWDSYSSVLTDVPSMTYASSEYIMYKIAEKLGL